MTDNKDRSWYRFYCDRDGIENIVEIVNKLKDDQVYDTLWTWSESFRFDKEKQEWEVLINIKKNG